MDTSPGNHVRVHNARRVRQSVCNIVRPPLQLKTSYEEWIRHDLSTVVTISLWWQHLQPPNSQTLNGQRTRCVWPEARVRSTNDVHRDRQSALESRCRSSCSTSYLLWPSSDGATFPTGMLMELHYEVPCTNKAAIGQLQNYFTSIVSLQIWNDWRICYSSILSRSSIIVISTNNEVSVRFVCKGLLCLAEVLLYASFVKVFISILHFFFLILHIGKYSEYLGRGKIANTQGEPFVSLRKLWLNTIDLLNLNHF